MFQRDEQILVKVSSPVILLLFELLPALLFVTAWSSSGKWRQRPGEVGRITLLLVMAFEDKAVLILSS